LPHTRPGFVADGRVKQDIGSVAVAVAVAVPFTPWLKTITKKSKTFLIVISLAPDGIYSTQSLYFQDAASIQISASVFSIDPATFQQLPCFDNGLLCRLRLNFSLFPSL